MEKLQLLLERYPEKVMSMLDELYKENFKKNKKKIFHFEALGKKYDSDKFVDNYVNFLKDVNKIHPYEFFKLSIHEYYMSKCPNDFNECHLVRNQVYKISENFYVSTYSSTDKKIQHIKSICELLGATLIEIS
jgi:hypothetical protein